MNSTLTSRTFALIFILALLTQMPSAFASGPPRNDSIDAATIVDAIPFKDGLDTTLATRADRDPPTGGRDCFGTEAGAAGVTAVVPK